MATMKLYRTDKAAQTVAGTGKILQLWPLLIAGLFLSACQEEAKSAQGDEFGFQRLNSAVALSPPHIVLDSVLTEIERFAQTARQYDDITMVGFSRTE